MATYLQGVTDYIPDYQPFQPDLNFYANVLQTKQNQYDTNYRSLNNLYSTLYNAPLTHDLNKEKKDILLKQIDDNLKKVTGLDLSLEQNVQQATQVFRPFYEDKYLMKDMAWTKNTMNVLNRANALQDSEDEKVSSQWWQTGIDAINFKTQEFADSDLNETLNIGNVKYTKWTNAIQKYLDMATKLKISAETKTLDETGNYLIRQKNGNLIIPTLQELFNAEYAKNPQIQEVYKTEAYVRRKRWALEHQEEYNGDILASEQAYLQTKYDYVKNMVAKRNAIAKENLTVTQNKADAVEQDIQSGNVNPKQKAYLEALAGGATVQEAILASTKVLNKNLNTGSRTVVTEGPPSGLDLTNMKVARMRIDAGIASLLATRDINAAARAYSNIGKVYEKDISKLGMERIRHGNAIARLNHAARLKRTGDKQTQYEKWGLENGVFIYDKSGNLINNPKFDGAFREDSGGDPGLTSDKDIDTRELNKKTWENFTKEKSNPYFNQIIPTIQNLVESNSITMEELTNMIDMGYTMPKSGMTILKEEIANRYNLKDFNFDQNPDAKADYKKGMEALGDKAYEITEVVDPERVKSVRAKWNSIYKKWSDPKTRSKILNQLASGNGIRLYEKFNEWTARNPGSNVVKEYYTNPQSQKNIIGFQSYKNNYDANEAVFEKNNNIIEGALIEKLSNYELDEDIEAEIATEFNNAINSAGSEGDDGKSGFAERFKRSILPKLNEMLDRKQQEAIAKGTILPQPEQGSEWNETKGITSSQWESINTILLNDPRMQDILRSENLEIDPNTPITSADFWDIPRAQGLGNVSRLRDKIVKEYVDVMQVTAGGALTTQDDINNTINNMFNSLNAEYDRVVFLPSNSEGALLQYISTVSDTERGGRAAVGAGTQSEYVNMKVPSSKGFKDYIGFVNDVNNINFNQAGNYRISTQGNMKPENFNDGVKHDISQDMAKTLLQNAYLSSKENSKGYGDLKITNNQVSLEDENTGSMTAFFPRKYLEDNIKVVSVGGVASSKAEAVQAFIDKIYNNGLTFIAPKAEWGNDFFNNNQIEPTLAIINALGSIKYEHPNGAGSYNLEKISGVPGVTHRGTYSITYITPSGEIKQESRSINYFKDRDGSSLDQIQNGMYNTISNAAATNQKLYEDFYRSKNQEALDLMNQRFGMTPADMLWRYND